MQRLLWVPARSLMGRGSLAIFATRSCGTQPVRRVGDQILQSSMVDEIGLQCRILDVLPVPEKDGEVVVTGRVMIRDGAKWIKVGGRYYLNPHYRAPWYDTGLTGSIVGPPLAAGAAYSGLGREFLVGGARVALLGNRTKRLIGQLPHYHRRGLGPNGMSRDGQGIGRHRPFEGSRHDTKFRDRF